MRIGYVLLSNTVEEDKPDWYLKFLSEFQETEERTDVRIGDRITASFKMIGTHPKFDDIGSETDPPR